MVEVLSASSRTSENLVAIADQFAVQGRVVDVQALGSGNINDTFLVMLDSQERFILQRVNTQVFRQPELVMQNMRTFSEHVHQRLQCSTLQDDRRQAACKLRRWEVPRVLVTHDAQDYWIDNGSFWRAISFIDASESFDTIQDIEHGREVGVALGRFHSLISDLPPTRLADTLEGFHITPRYLQQYEQVLGKQQITHSLEVNYCLRFVSDRKNWASVLETAKAAGRLLLRPIHGDPKVNNVMIDTVTRKAVGMVDLDTVKPGLIHYDIGDCLRSGCNLQGEETERWETVRFEPDLCQAILQGYLAEAKGFLSAADYDYLYDAIRLIAFELGLRFFTDYLAGNVYFKVRHPEHNLTRALVQFRLTESIEAQEALIRRIIQELR